VNAPSSLFVFLHRQLRLSKGAASYRATAAALIQRIPEVVEPLRDGLLCLSTIFEIAKVLTPENRTEVLPRFFHRSKTGRDGRGGPGGRARSAPSARREAERSRDEAAGAQRPSKPGHIPAAVKRAVWARDGGCCAWRLEDGSVCGSRRRVQYDHVRPEAHGGESTVENVRLLCQAHNLLARRIFGDAWMDRFRRGREAANVERDLDAPDAPQRPS
jgi:5-methylcytosine-specific restriction endonuclease McrA